METESDNKTPEYKLRYENKRAALAASFNLEKKEDRELHEYAKNLTPSFSVWVKNQLIEHRKLTSTPPYS